MILEDSELADKTTRFYAKWPVRNFGQKHELQFLEKYAIKSRKSAKRGHCTRAEQECCIMTD